MGNKKNRDGLRGKYEGKRIIGIWKREGREVEEVIREKDICEPIRKPVRSFPLMSPTGVVRSWRMALFVNECIGKVGTRNVGK